MPIAVIPEQLALQAAIRGWATAADVRTTVRRQEPVTEPAPGSTAQPTAEPAARAEPWRRHWPGLVDLGVFGTALPESAGGAGGTVTDLAAALEQVTDALVPGPVMPTLLAGLLLTPHLALPTVKALLAELAAGRATVAVAFGTGTVTGTPDGAALRVGGRVGPVLGAGTTSHLLLAAATPGGTAWFLVEADHPGVRLTPRTPVDFSRSLADVELRDLPLGADDRLTGPTGMAPGAIAGTDRVPDVAVLLGAVEAAAVAGWCLRTATEYAKIRRQFDRPIGSFQAVKHLCAGMLCRAERAAALAWDAATALDQRANEFPLAAAAAAAVALEAAVDNAKDCVQVLGGIGFTWEHDAHLYLRRALALRQLLGDGALWRHRVAELALGGARRSSRRPGSAPESWSASTPEPAGVESAAESDPDRAAVRARLARIAALPAADQRAALADAGYLAPQWPKPYGLDASPADQLMIDEELSRAGVVRPELAIAGWAVPTILRHGTLAQRERFAGPSLRGELTWCQLFSEPEAGSDLASLRTRARPVAGGWRLSGQKVWTSLANQAHWGICLARTDPAVAKHRGLSYFLVAMDAPGVEVRPLREITGRAVFNEVFLDDVFVPDDCLVGQPGDGWRLARGTLEHERVAMGRGSSLGDDVERLLGTVRLGGAGTRDPLGDAGVRDRLGGLVADGLAISLLDLRATLRRLGGEPDAAEAAVAKLVGVGHRQAVAEAALSWAGPDGAAADRTAAEPVHQFLLSRCLSIAGGTTQVLLTLVAERVLGLPREAR